MKKLSFVLALVLTLGVFGSMFAVGAADEPAVYNVETFYRGYAGAEWASAGLGVVNSDLSQPGTGLQLQFTKGDNYYETYDLFGALSGISAFVMDIGEAQTVNAVCYSICKRNNSAEKHAEDRYWTFWYSVDGVNYTKLENVTIEATSDEYYQYNPTRNDDSGYAMPFKASFAEEIEARYLMFSLDYEDNGGLELAYAKGNLYMMLEERVVGTPNTGDTLSIVALGTVAAVAGIVIVSKKKKNV